MHIATDMTLWGLVMQSSLPVRIVLLLLLLASVCSWAVIFGKQRTIKRARKAMERFEKRFRSGADLTEIYNQTASRGEIEEGLPALYKAGYEELRWQRSQGRAGAHNRIDFVQRAMRIVGSGELDRLERGLPILATIGSISPYVGLFGTVWGIMSAFIALGNVNQASLAMVAPSIAEALIATAMGLFAAIPAVIAYNHFSHQIDMFENRFQTFTEHLSSMVGREAIAHRVHSERCMTGDPDATAGLVEEASA